MAKVNGTKRIFFAAGLMLTLAIKVRIALETPTTEPYKLRNVVKVQQYTYCSSSKFLFFYCSGREEAITAGKTLKAEGYEFDVAHTSVLKRAQITLSTILNELGQPDIPVEKSWRLNERHYGGLTGLNKAETAAKYGEAQVNTFNFVDNGFDVTLAMKHYESYLNSYL